MSDYPTQPPLPGAPAPQPTGPTPGLSTASLVCGILSVVACGCLAGIPAVICGHKALALHKADPSLQGKTLATVGLILGYVSIGLTVILGIVYAFVMAAAVTSAAAQ